MKKTCCTCGKSLNHIKFFHKGSEIFCSKVCMYEKPRTPIQVELLDF